MRSDSLPSAISSTAARVALALSCGGAGSLAAAVLIRHAGTPVIAAGAVAAALAGNAVASAFKSLPDVIEAVGSLLATLIRGRADARATIVHAKIRAELAREGLDPMKTHQAIEMQRLLLLNPDLPPGRRLADDALIKLNAASRTRNGGTETVTGPDAPGTHRSNAKVADSKVVPLRSDT
jgi:hypothetical protein